MGASYSEPVSELVPLHSGNTKTGASLEGLEVGARSHTSYGGRLQEESYHRSDWKEWWETPGFLSTAYVGSYRSGPYYLGVRVVSLASRRSNERWFALS